MLQIAFGWDTVDGCEFLIETSRLFDVQSRLFALEDVVGGPGNRLTYTLDDGRSRRSLHITVDGWGARAQEHEYPYCTDSSPVSTGRPGAGDLPSVAAVNRIIAGV